jgi:hypothetical protein
MQFDGGWCRTRKADIAIFSLRRNLPVIDNGRPKIAAAYREFRDKHPEPGIAR